MSLPRRVIPYLVSCVLLVSIWRVAVACGPSFIVAVFHYSKHPDLPRSKFLDGKLGLIQPTWARSYLVVSWRYLSGVGLDAREKQQAASYYADRATGWWDKTGTDWEQRWQDTRARFTNAPSTPRTTVIEGKYQFNQATNSFDLACADDAFRTAVGTLESRARRFGSGSAALKAWIDAQDAVFSNCENKGPIPGPAPETLPAQIRDDRRYQIAAARFYAKNYPEARDGFRAISADSKSEWSNISRYLVVRTLLRMNDSAGVAREGKEILSDNKLRAIHAMTANLLDRSHIASSNADALRRYGDLLRSKGQGNGLREALWNYTTAYDNTGERPDELSRWIANMQSSDAASWKVSLEAWRRSKSLPWLVAALSHADYVSAEQAGLLDAAQAVPETSPAWETLTYHYYRVLLNGRQSAAVRNGVDSLLQSGRLQPSSVSMFRGLRRDAAPDLAGFLQFAADRPVLLTDSMDEAETPSRDWRPDIKGLLPLGKDFLDEPAAATVNAMPLRMLKELTTLPNANKHLKREQLFAALTRGLLLEEDLAELAQALGSTDPQLEKLTNAIVQAGDEEAARFAAAHLILLHPEAKPFVVAGVQRQTPNGVFDDFRENLWCPVGKRAYIQRGLTGASAFFNSDAERPPTPVRASFLDAADRREAEVEMKKMAATGRATDYLGAIVLRWAARHPSDPRVPEALFREIRSARITCDGDRETKVNRAAFRLLKGRYAKTVWAQKIRVR